VVRRSDEAHRFRCVIDYLHGHIDDRLTVEQLSSVARLSKFHFHRRFSEVLGIGVYEYIKLLRLRRAAYEIAFRERPILDVALSSGYGSHAAFSRAFRKVVGQSPSDFRAMPRSSGWLSAWSNTQRRLDKLTTRRLSSCDSSQVRTVIFRSIRVAALEHRGDPSGLNVSLQRFIAWRKGQPRSVRTSAIFNLAYSDPSVTASENFRFDICAATDRSVAANLFGVVEKTIPGGRCATLRHFGSNGTLGDAVSTLRRWLQLSGETLRDFPLILHRIQLFPDVPEHEAVTDVMLPLA
jgi:AraC family transcriptional regulator